MHFSSLALLAAAFDLALAFDPWDLASLRHRTPSELVHARRSLHAKAQPRFGSPYAKRQTTDCISANPASTVTDRLQAALNKTGDVLTLCPNENYLILQPINFTATDQEIHTLGYPTDDTRACLTVNGIVFNGTGHTTAINGQCTGCDRAVVRNIQVNGTRGSAGPTSGGANLEMGGDTSGQLIEYVHSFDPRSWSCLHIAEGPFTCRNVTVINNDIGPCGSDLFQEWADGISLSCQTSYVAGNFIDNPTDGGIVVFGSPGSLVENNTIWVTKNTLLGGLNMVDYNPWKGNYTNTVVQNNLVVGGLATDTGDETTAQKGDNNEDVIVKIGLAVGPRTWFGEFYYNNVSENGVARNNIFTGAFGYGIAVSSAFNFTVMGNMLAGNTSFIGSRGPNCSTGQILPNPEPFVWNSTTVTDSTIQTGFVNLDVDSLTCVEPPSEGNYWPFGGEPVPGTDIAGVPNAEETNSTTSGTGSSGSSGRSSGTNSGSSGSSSGASSSGLSQGGAIGLGVGLGLAAICAILLFFLIRSYRRSSQRNRPVSDVFDHTVGLGQQPGQDMGMKERVPSWQAYGGMTQPYAQPESSYRQM
ncbi:hypothetical protein CALVIDRAFT_496781 [Calocera viscosa TUFC12733]|uniref:Right handed beta helix domain-containing protein n=1 Tax=Calocera viscosa (strain TUFC12733) TaxID=1330018 RepID=A0A167NX21_CALVF|nr:hypothetical protein CALVIDRAFT_496781 [Calocera viscosa TUFC12733]